MSARRFGVGLAGAIVVALGLTGCVTKGPPQSITFGCTGGPQTWVVPPNVVAISVELFGAEGGSTDPEFGGPIIPGGRGGYAATSFLVTPGETLQINVGCAGQSTSLSEDIAGAGGFGGGPGGDGGATRSGGGGGGTDLRRGGTLLLAAGGGGGAGGGAVSGNSQGGDGGGANGGAGGPGVGGVTGGGGGTQSSGGAAGTGCTGGPTAGALGQGGDGGDRPGPQGGSGGGGGGGYFGGGGGCDGNGSPAAGGGGGGSGFGPAGTTLVTGLWEFGDGLAVIRYRTTMPS